MSVTVWKVWREQSQNAISYLQNWKPLTHTQKSKLYGTAVCAIAIKPQGKWREWQSLYSWNETLQGWKLKGEPPWASKFASLNLKILPDRKLVIQLSNNWIFTTKEDSSEHLQYGGDVVFKNTRGLWLWLEHYRKVISTQHAGGTYPRLQPVILRL